MNSRKIVSLGAAAARHASRDARVYKVLFSDPVFVAPAADRGGAAVLGSGRGLRARHGNPRRQVHRRGVGKGARQSGHPDSRHENRSGRREEHSGRRQSHRSVAHDGPARPGRLPHPPGRSCGRRAAQCAATNRGGGCVPGHPQRERHAARRLYHGARCRRLPGPQRCGHARRHRARHHHRTAHVRRGRVHHHQRGRRRDDRAVARYPAALGLALRRGQQPVGSAAEDSRARAPRRRSHQGSLHGGRSHPRQQPEIHRIHARGAARRRRGGRQFRSSRRGARACGRRHQECDSRGSRVVEHATLIDDEGIALAKQHGTYLDMDIYDEECIQSAPEHAGGFSAARRGARRGATAQLHQGGARRASR